MSRFHKSKRSLKQSLKIDYAAMWHLWSELKALENPRLFISFFGLLTFSLVHLCPYVIGAHGFSFSVMFKYDFSAKLLESSCCFTAKETVSLLVPLTGQFTDTTTSSSVCKEKKDSILLKKDSNKAGEVNRATATNNDLLKAMFRLDLQFEILRTDTGNNCLKTLTGHFLKMSLTNWQCGLTLKIKVCSPAPPEDFFFLISFGIYSLVNTIQRLIFSVELTSLTFQNFNPSRRKENSQSWVFLLDVNLLKNFLQCVSVR